MLLLLAVLQTQTIPPLPDSSGWGVHVLAIARAPDSAVWVGTYGQGIFVLRPGRGTGEGGRVWERIRSSRDTAAHAISWDFVHAFGFGPKGQVWYGTVGNGWGVSTDGGKTWRNWEFGQLGPEWQYVAPNGIMTRGDTTYIATADGIKLTWDDGQAWRVVTDAMGATTARDSVWGRIGNQYALSLQLSPLDTENIAVRYPSGGAISHDGGRTWRDVPMDSRTEFAAFMHRTFLEARKVGLDIGLCSDRRVEVPYELLSPEGLIGSPWGLLQMTSEQQHDCLALPGTPRSLRRSGRVGAPRHTWFRRPIALTDQPYIDQTYRFGSTMGGNFQPHQGVEFNNGDGTPVHAIGDGVVVHSGPAERGALTVAIRHDRTLTADGRRLHLFSAYYHNSKVLVQSGQRVKTGDVIALVGNTGRATNDHIHLEVHAAPYDSTRLIVDPEVRYPLYNTNPELWIDPLPGTGIVAGQVWDSAGKPVQQARIYGLVKPEPTETPFSFIETYGARNHPDPVYQEHFAVSDVPPGEYVIGVAIGGKRVFRRVNVAAGKLTWVEFRP